MRIALINNPLEPRFIQEQMAESHWYLAKFFHHLFIENYEGLIVDNEGNKIDAKDYLHLAKKNIEESLNIEKNIEGFLEDKANKLELYSKILFTTKDYANAYVMQVRSQLLMDSVFNMGKEKDIANIEYTQKAINDSLKNEQAKLQIENEHVTAMAKKDSQRNILVFSGLGVLLLAGGLFTRLRYVRKSKNLIEKEKEHAEHERKRSDELLLNILPSDVAEELKDKGSIKAKHIEDVSILFTDCEGFTQASEKMTPTELVDEINIYFKAFDLICEKHNIEKIKTIGDAYMAASGLGSKNKVQSLKDASNLVSATLEMQDFVQKRAIELETLNLKPFQMRFAIHTGPVVAGIVGIKKFQYDIWGDTVNTAARMESAGEVGRVNISQTTYELLRDDADFAFESRGKIEAKGKGEMEMFFVS